MIDGKFEAADFSYDEEPWNTMNALLPQLKAQWLAELLRDAPVVYGREVPTGERIRWSGYRFAETTHAAKLIAIEEIVE